MKYFYCSIIDGKKKGLLAGPYDTKAEAEWVLPHAIRKAQEVNATQAAFASFGTAGANEVFKTVFGRIEP